MRFELAPLREYLLLREHEARSRVLPTAKKIELEAQVVEQREVRRAANVLWAGGSPAQGYRLAVEALRAALAAAERDGIVLENADEIASLKSRIDALPGPKLDRDISVQHAQLFERLCGVGARVGRALEPYADDAPAIARRRRAHWLRAAIVSVLLVAFLVLFVKGQFRTKVSASAFYAPKYEAENVTDGQPNSEWLLPNTTGGWLDVQLSPRRTVHAVRLLNAHNIGHEDRATHEYRIEVYSHGSLVKSVDAEFPEFSSTPQWVTVDLGENRGVERVRIVVKSWFLNGGGLSEVRVD